jgi:hypothetical protein
VAAILCRHGQSSQTFRFAYSRVVNTDELDKTATVTADGQLDLPFAVSEFNYTLTFVSVALP